MSALGQERTSPACLAMSALPPKADMRRGRDVACASPSGPLRAQREAVRPRRSSSGGLALARGGAFAINDYLDMEQRWLALARSYEFAERLSRFAAPFSKGKKPKNSRRPDQKEPPRL